MTGTAMGTNCAPSYANLFLGWWEYQLVFTDTNGEYTDHILFWGRYIDDVLILWDGDVHLFSQFVSTLNNNQIGMKFTSEVQMREIAFLDLTISIDDCLQLQTNIYRKPTSTNSFLHWHSYHTPALKNGIPIGQYLRARRNCSTEVDFQNECKTLYQRFCERGSPNAHSVGPIKEL